jgi:hypothetical protein
MKQKLQLQDFPAAELEGFIRTLQAAGHTVSQFDVSQVPIDPPLLPGPMVGIVTVKRMSNGAACTYVVTEESPWLADFEADLAAGRFENGWAPTVDPMTQDLD